MVNHGSIFTTHDNNDIHISALIDAFRNRQFTMHVVVNAGAVDKRRSFVDIFLKVTGKRISKTYQDIWDARSKSFFRNNSWVDTPVMMNIVEIFVKHNVEVHGADIWVLLFCDNLKAHVNDQVRNIF